jgi:hypothetical protein
MQAIIKACGHSVRMFNLLVIGRQSSPNPGLVAQIITCHQADIVDTPGTGKHSEDTVNGKFLLNCHGPGGRTGQKKRHYQDHQADPRSGRITPAAGGPGNRK